LLHNFGANRHLSGLDRMLPSGELFLAQLNGRGRLFANIGLVVIPVLAEHVSFLGRHKNSSFQAWRAAFLQNTCQQLAPDVGLQVSREWLQFVGRPGCDEMGYGRMIAIGEEASGYPGTSTRQQVQSTTRTRIIGQGVSSSSCAVGMKRT